MSKQINVLNHITSVLQTELPIKQIQISPIDDSYVLEMYSNDNKYVSHFISKSDLECMDNDMEIYYYTKVVTKTVSKLLQKA